MDRQAIDHLLGTFCHLDLGRSFPFDVGHSLICHRCTSIYSSFLLVTLFAWAFKWKGQILNWVSKKAVFICAATLLAICGVQVGLQFLDPNWGHPLARIITGALVAVGLFQLSQLSRDDFPLKPGQGYQPLLLIGFFALHLFILHQSFVYNSITTLAGLVWLYHQINFQVLAPWLEGKSSIVKHSLIVLAIGIEWLALYAINVQKIHV